MPKTASNMFLEGPLGSIYVRTALPIIFVMGMNGLLAVADALFLGLTLVVLAANARHPSRRLGLYRTDPEGRR
ncbi:hypothetical protein [Stappia sp.]|uniref:hypothetical protein n=1 Tax=Stappia sp. TaxID=1870903 RepID=UPI003C7E8779